MTERSAAQAPVDARPQGQEGRQDTTRIPLADRLQRPIANADDRRANGASGSNGQSSRVLPPMPSELSAQRTEERPAKSAQPAPAPVAPRPAEEPTGRAAQRPPATTAPAAAPTPPARRPPRRTSKAPARAPRRARLRLSRIDPWSVMKVSFLLSIAFGIVTVVSVFMIWSVLNAAGVWTSINNTVSDTVSSGTTSSTFNIEDYLGMSRVLGFTMLVAVIDVVLITAIATLGAFLYNMASSLLGGIEVTLSEDQG